MPWPSASDADSGTQIASTARIISGQGTGVRFGRTTSKPASRVPPRPAPPRPGPRRSWSGQAPLIAFRRRTPPIFVPKRAVVTASPPRPATLGHGRVPPWTIPGLWSRLSADYGDLRDCGGGRRTHRAGTELSRLDRGQNLVVHVAEVYLHKATIMQTGQDPEPVARRPAWPPRRRWPCSAGPTASFEAEFRAREADSPAAYLVRAGPDGGILDPPDGPGDSGAPDRRRTARRPAR